MWKNVFIESCILSALIFGGFYLNTTLLKKEIKTTQNNIQNKTLNQRNWEHISGTASLHNSENPSEQSTHLSGNEIKLPVPPISGSSQPFPTTGE